MIGREEVGTGGWRKRKQHIKHVFFFFIYCCSLGDFCAENIIKKEWSSTGQASNETVAKFLDVPFCKSRERISYSAQFI